MYQSKQNQIKFPNELSKIVVEDNNNDDGL